MSLALWLIAAVIAVLAVSWLADRWNTSPPLLLIIFGLAASFLPIVPNFELEPEIVLIGILPPLLFSAAYNTSFIDFKAKRATIASLSVGLVIFTTVFVGVVTWLFVPDIPLAAGFALGAIVAPPDAVAATAIARRVGMPTAIVQILEGESLMNDATALTALRTAIGAVAGTVTILQVGLQFLVAAGGGIVIGLAFALVGSRVRMAIKNPIYDSALSFVTPYLAYVCAEAIEASGVVAVVIAGLLFGHKAPLLQSGTARLTTEANWRTVSFVLENGVFLLIGLQLPTIVEGVEKDDVTWPALLVACAAVYVLTVVTRFVWVFGFGSAAKWGWLRRSGGVATWSGMTVVSWAGMRGVVTLAAALTLPTDLTNREALILIAFFVVVVSLLLQGTTLPWLVKALRLRPPDAGEQALQQATLLADASRAGMAELQVILNTSAKPVLPGVVERLEAYVRDRKYAAWELVAAPGDTEAPVATYTRLRLRMLRSEREAVVAARDSGKYDDEVIRRVIRVLDVEEAMLDTPAIAGSQREQPLEPGEGRGTDCQHFAAAQDLAVPAVLACSDCENKGTVPVHFRMCLTCGKVGCCDSSEGQHAYHHYAETGHPVIRSVEPGEAWRWCFADEIVASAAHNRSD